jgi:hypothetical protein
MARVVQHRGWALRGLALRGLAWRGGQILGGRQQKPTPGLAASGSAFPRLWFNRSSCCGEIAMGAVSYLLFLGAMLGLALGLYFGLRTAKLI